MRLRPLLTALLLTVVIDLHAQPDNRPRVTASHFLSERGLPPNLAEEKVVLVSGVVTAVGRVAARTDGLFRFPDFGACRQRKCGGYTTLDGKFQALFHPDDDAEVGPLRKGQRVELGCIYRGINTAFTHALGTECFVMPPPRKATGEVSFKDILGK